MPLTQTDSTKSLGTRSTPGAPYAAVAAVRLRDRGVARGELQHFLAVAPSRNKDQIEEV